MRVSPPSRKWCRQNESKFVIMDQSKIGISQTRIRISEILILDGTKPRVEMNPVIINNDYLWLR